MVTGGESLAQPMRCGENNKDDNNEMTHSKVKSYSSIVRTAPPPPEDRKVGLSSYFTYTWFGHDVK